MNLLMRKGRKLPVQQTTLVILVDCEPEDFIWLQRRCVDAVEKEIDRAVGEMFCFEGDINLSWQRRDML